MNTTTTTRTAGLFDALTSDELQALAGALITRDDRDHRGYSANRMSAMLGQLPGADDAYHTYRDIAREIGQLHGQVLDRYVAVITRGL